MKKSLFYLFMVAMMAMAPGYSWAQSGEGVTIGGVTWAKTNVGNAGEFVANPEDYGGYFTFDEAKTACPEGWHTPGVKELEALAKVGSEWTTVNGVNGRKFTSGEHTVFFPAAGWRNPFFGDEGGLGDQANYWSGSANANTRAYGFVLSTINNKDYFVGICSQGDAFSVRCVHE